MLVVLKRVYSDAKFTRGILLLGKQPLCHTLEPPWRENEKNLSCIPEGSYTVIKTVSPRFGDCFYFRDVPARSGILIHSGNRVEHTRGCILVGLDADGENVLHSRLAMNRLFSKLPSTFNIQIRKVL